MESTKQETQEMECVIATYFSITLLHHDVPPSDKLMEVDPKIHRSIEAHNLVHSGPEAINITAPLKAKCILFEHGCMIHLVHYTELLKTTKIQSFWK